MSNNLSADCVEISKEVFARKNNELGWIVIHSDGHAIISDTFDLIEPKNNVIIAKKGALYGAYAFDGACLLPCSCECIEVYTDAIVYKINNKYGLVSKTGKNICLPIYEQCRVLSYEDNLKETLEQHMSKETKTLYRKINERNEDNWLLNDYIPQDYVAKVQKNIEYYVFIHESNSFVCNSTDGIISQIPNEVLHIISPDALLVKENGKNGVYSLTEKRLIIPCHYDDIQYFGFAYGCLSYVKYNNKFNILFNEENDQNNACLCDTWDLYCYDTQDRQWVRFNLEHDCCSQLSVIGSGIFCLSSEHEIFNIIPRVIHVFNDRIYDSYRGRNFWEQEDCNLCLYRPPYFLNKDCICVPVLENSDPNSFLQRKRLTIRDREHFEVLERYLEYLTNDLKITLTRKVIDDDGYTQLELVTWKKKMGVYALAGDNKWSRILDYKYNDIQLREDGNFDVRINDSWGIVSKSGNEILGVKYSQKVNSVYVHDAYTGKSGVLNKNLTREVIPTLYDTIVFFNEIGVNRDFYYNESYCIDDCYIGADYEKPIAVGKSRLLDSDEEQEAINMQFALIKGSTLITDYLYSRLMIRGNYLIAFRNRIADITHDVNGRYYPIYDVIDIFDRYRNNICSFNDAYVCTTDNPDLFIIVHKLSNSQITKAYMCSFEDEGGWKTLDYDWVKAVNDNCFIVKNYAEIERNPMSARYALVDRNGKGTNFEYMFISAPIDGWFFAAREIKKIVEQKIKRRSCNIESSIEYYNVYLLNTENLAEENSILAFESVNINDLSTLVTSGAMKCSTPEFINWLENLDQELVKRILSFTDRIWESEILENYMEIEELEEDNSYSGRDDWDYERDSWYAMTDGQYGDYPGSADADDFYEGSGW